MPYFSEMHCARKRIIFPVIVIPALGVVLLSSVSFRLMRMAYTTLSDAIKPL